MKNLIPHFIQERFLENQTHGHFRAFAMFVDLSGFTHLTQTLMKRGNVGAEQLSSILNDIFGPMVRLVYRRGGFIPYYAGDAFTAVFFENKLTEEEFLDTAKRIRALTQGENAEFHGFKIHAKIGLSFGDIEWGIVGEENKAFYFRGEAVKGSADAQAEANQQEIHLDKNIAEKVREKIYITTVSGSEYYLWLNPDDLPKVRIPKKRRIPVLDEEVLKRFMPEAVIGFDGRGEFRNVISVFIAFKGVHNHDLLNEFASEVLRQFHNFSGYFKEVDFGDKGGLMVGFIGAPVSFENNTERALEFVTVLRENTEELVKNTGLRFRVGVTSGIAYTGNIGSEERTQYAVVGNNVNLAARLMSYAEWGEISTDEEVQRSRFFRFRGKGAINYKGFEKPILTFSLRGRNNTALPVYAGSLIGREEEMQSLFDIAERVFSERRPSFVYLYGEAGIGKSRLLFELRERLQEQRRIVWLVCPADQILRKPFNPFITFFRNYFAQSTENTKEQNVELFFGGFERLAKDIEKIAGETGNRLRRNLFRTRAVLTALVGLPPENDFWENLDARGRYRNTFTALADFFIAEAVIAPIVIELEDVHWYDENSKEFLREFIKQVRHLPIFFLAASRYADDGTKPRVVELHLLEKQDIAVHEFDLNILQSEGMRQFAEKQLRGPVSEEFHALLQRTTNGNPFYLEQVLEYFTESKLLTQKDGMWHIEDENVKISGSINSILTARIDRLSRLVKETVKAAAVIGREFEVPVLQEVLSMNEAFAEEEAQAVNLLKEQIDSAEKGQIWRAMNELRYIFKHSLLREAVYDMQLRARLRELHAHIGQAIEKIYADNLEERYVDLAFHYEQAEDKEKARIYFAKAAAYSRRNFQNEQAIQYYDKLVKLLNPETEKTEVIKAMLRKGAVMELIGQWGKCEKTYVKALKLSESTDSDMLKGRTRNSMGHLMLLKGNYERAAVHLRKAAVHSERADDARCLSKIYGNLGNLHFRQGAYEEAKAFFKRSIEISRLDEHSSALAQIVANLGLTYMNQGDYDEGIKWQRDQLIICRENGDKQGMATLNVNLGIVHLEQGDYDSALTCFQDGLTLCEELGNKQLISIAVGCMGSVYERKGNYDRAMELFMQDLRLTEELGDKQGISIALGLIGDLLNVQGKFEEAKEYMEKNLALCRELGYQKGTAKALNTLGDIAFNQEKYEKAIDCYDEAVHIARRIKNVLILSESLSEKAEAQMALGELTSARKCIREAAEIAAEIGNKELIFLAEILSAKITADSGKRDKALTALENMSKQNLSKSKKATVFYELYKLTDSNIHRKEALALYQTLYRATPQYLYRERMRDLE